MWFTRKASELTMKPSLKISLLDPLDKYAAEFLIDH